MQGSIEIKDQYGSVFIYLHSSERDLDVRLKDPIKFALSTRRARDHAYFARIILSRLMNQDNALLDDNGYGLSGSSMANDVFTIDCDAGTIFSYDDVYDVDCSLVDFLKLKPKF
ncbi:hypothetical protein [Psychromonas sp. Urea-02u-13]|uniref:hypothetical protein n=1 Tax=Psychromonas sp. Urea-02u-13 TaxID=2058326 RepID=UPI000C32C526|nr:hypothetical protein [Psychromonas sp. Urea-02u-13]PKG40209.1 hypothetical protein CXF74_03820 [Psychromonas sp. Urea-02u-13]